MSNLQEAIDAYDLQTERVTNAAAEIDPRDADIALKAAKRERERIANDWRLTDAEKAQIYDAIARFEDACRSHTRN